MSQIKTDQEIEEYVFDSSLDKIQMWKLNIFITLVTKEEAKLIMKSYIKSEKWVVFASPNFFHCDKKGRY